GGRGGRPWAGRQPLTGRPHRLGVLGPAGGGRGVGAAIYGRAPRGGGPPLHLHAREVAVPLYPKREPVRVIAPVPAHMRDALTACGGDGEDVPAPATAPLLSKSSP